VFDLNFTHLLLKRIDDMFFLWIQILIIALAANSLAPIQADQKKKKEKVEEIKISGEFGPKKNGAGFVLLEGYLFVQAIVIHDDVVESGIFLLDTGISTGCVMERHFADKMKVVGIGNVVLKIGDCEIKYVKATVLDHPDLMKLFRKNVALFQNKPVCGVIGYPALTAQKTVIDFSNMTIRFPTPKPKEEDKGCGTGAEAKANPEKKQVDKKQVKKKDDVKRFIIPYMTGKDDKSSPKTIWLDLKLNDKVQGVFHLSTGSPSSWILKDVAKEAELRRNKPPRSLKSGDIDLSPLTFKFKTLMTHPISASSPYKVIGGLGSDFLQNYKTVFDPENQRLVLTAIKKPAPAPVKKTPRDK